MLLYLLLAILQIASAAGYCYSRNGTTLLNAAFQPCGNKTVHSACCMTNHSGAGDVGIADDVCMENGLCQNYAVYDGKNEGQQVWSRQGCTDPLWNSPYCLADVCNKPEYADQWGNVGVWNCGGENWCCGEKTCCDDKENIFALAATVGPPSTVPSATSFSSASASSASTSTASPSLEENAQPRRLSKEEKASIKAAIAAVIVIVVIAIPIAFLIMRRRKMKRQKITPLDGTKPHKDVPEEEKHSLHVQTREQSPHHGYSELGQREHAELATNNMPQELEAGGGNLR